MSGQKVAVIGASGAVGTLLVETLEVRNVAVVPISRALGVDVRTGEGLAEALTGTDTIIDVANVVTTGRRKSVEFFRDATNNLLSAGRGAGVRHHVVLSIVGIDDVDYGYYEGKRVQEKLLSSSQTPHTVLRATQFHEFAGQMLQRMRFGPVAAIPNLNCRPVAASEVAELLADIAGTGPTRSADGRPVEMAGPEELSLYDMVKRLQRVRGDRCLAVPVPVPGRAGRLMRSGGLLPRPGYHQGVITFDEWLADQDDRRSVQEGSRRGHASDGDPSARA